MEKLFEKVILSSDGGELFKKEEEVSSIGLRQGEVQEISGKKTFDIALRLVKDGNMGSAVSTSLEDATIIDRALISCRYQKQEAISFSSDSPAAVECYDERVAEISLEEMVEESERILDLFRRQDKNIVPDVGITKSVKDIQIINSKGFNGSYRKTSYSVDVATKTPKGFYEISYGVEGADFKRLLEEEVAAVLERHRIAQNRLSIESGRIPVIFSGQAIGALMMRLIAGVKAGNVIKNISPLQGRLGEQVFSENITIRDNGTLAFGLGSCAFDDEGTKSKDTLLVEKGVLKNYLAGLSEAAKLGIEPTGNSFKRTMFSQDIEDAPAVDCTNLLIEGNSIPDQELIKTIKRGVFIDSVMGAHTGNIAAGEYSLNIRGGYLIEDGKMVGKIMDAMVAGNIYDDLKKVSAVGAKQEVMGGMFYNMGYSPMVLFDGLSVVCK